MWQMTWDIAWLPAALLDKMYMSLFFVCNSQCPEVGATSFTPGTADTVYILWFNALLFWYLNFLTKVGKRWQMLQSTTRGQLRCVGVIIRAVMLSITNMQWCDWWKCMPLKCPLVGSQHKNVALMENGRISVCSSCQFSDVVPVGLILWKCPPRVGASLCHSP